MKWFLIVLLSLVAECSSAQSDLRGPVLSDRFSVSRSAQGVFVTGLHDDAASARPSDRPFPWIWIDSVKHPALQQTRTPGLGHAAEEGLFVVNFKKVFVIDGPVERADIRISADIKYRIFINGRLVNRGPANIGTDVTDSLYPLHWFYDQFPARDAFKKGGNVIAVEVFTRDHTWSSATIGRPGLFMEAEIHLQSGKTLTVSTDKSWRCAPSEAFRPNGEYDALRGNAGWITLLGYEKKWEHAVPLTDRWNLQPSRLPQMMETRVLPAGITEDGVVRHFPLVIKASTQPRSLRLDFDNLYTGYLGLKLSGRAGDTIQLVTAELEKGEAQDMTYITADGSQTYESPFLMDGKYVYVTVRNPSADLVIEDISMNYSSFPVTYAGDFSCSDPFLTALWHNIRWVTQMNMQTYHMDSPLHQEPVGDAGDYLIESLVNYYAFGSSELARQDLRKIALVMQKKDYQMFHTSYMMLWLQMLTAYYQYTGDESLLRELAPTVYKLLAQFHGYVGPTGIITEAPNYMFMDWWSIGPIEFHHPPANLGQGYMTAFYYKGLLEGSKIASWLGDGPHAAQFTAEAAACKKAFVDQLYDPSRMLFKSGLPGVTHVAPHDWMPADTVIGQQLPYVNILALLYGLVPENARDSLLRYMVNERKVLASPYFMYFVFDAIASQDAFDRYGLGEMRRWKVLSEAPVGLREGWAMGDYSHAWGGSPAYNLSARVLGVVPALPGFREVLIEPHPGDLDSASGTVPTPQGPVTVRWRRSAKSFLIEVHNPLSMPVRFSLPGYRGDLRLNGRPAGATLDSLGRWNLKADGGDNIIEMTDEHKMDNVLIETGPFQPDWKQIGDHYRTPEWFNQAKFGIWIPLRSCVCTKRPGRDMS